jgi:hypothetical protein
VRWRCNAPLLRRSTIDLIFDSHLGDKRQGAVIGGAPAGGPEGGHIIRGVIE